MYAVILAYVSSELDGHPQPKGCSSVLLIKEKTVRGYNVPVRFIEGIPVHEDDAYGEWGHAAQLKGIQPETWAALVDANQRSSDLRRWIPESPCLQWVRGRDAPEFTGAVAMRYPEAGALVSLSAVGLGPGGKQALVYVASARADGVASGQYLLLVFGSKGWTVADAALLWTS